MSIYCSFFVFRPDQVELVLSLCKSAGWKAHFLPDPSGRYRFHGSGWSEVTNAEALPQLQNLNADDVSGELLVIEGDRDEATNIVEFIHAAEVVGEGFADRTLTAASVFEISKDISKHKAVFQSSGFFEQFSFKIHRPLAVELASRAWTERRNVYAVHKLSQSYSIDSITPWSVHPRYGEAFEKHSNLFADHVTASMAINLAYSAIEELGLQINSSRENPRWLDKNFTWNLSVLDDITSRLASIGIESDTKIDWIIRGEETEIRIQPERNQMSIYSDGKSIRDMQLSVPDAIHACSYLRNFITAHAFGRETSRLGPYEVYNVQQVARFLILSVCKLFNVAASEPPSGNEN